jgi:hypothetical protein
VKLGTIQSSWRRLNNHPALFVRDGARRDELAAAANGMHTSRGPEAGWQVAGWVRKALVQADGYKVAHADLLHSFHGWQHLEMGDDVVRPLDVRAFVPAMHLVCPWITTVKVFGHRYAAGVELNAEGSRYWERHRGLGSRGIAFSSEHGIRFGKAAAICAPSGQRRLLLSLACQLAATATTASAPSSPRRGRKGSQNFKPLARPYGAMQRRPILSTL